jgi:hypothetical protein
MLERVAQGQTRFNTPGISVDNRGVALGRYGALFFPSLDGVVGWLRLYSAEAGLEDLLAELSISRVQDRLKGRAFLVLLPAASSYVLDRAARCARLWGGAAFTGSAKHFVRYRDERSPYGWDVAQAVLGEGDYVLHGEDASQGYLKEGAIDLRTLVFRLSLQRVPGAERLDAEARASLVLTVPPGLAKGVIRYLWKNRVPTRVAHITLATRSEFSPGSPDGYLYARVQDLPERILEGFRGTPGLTIYRPISDTVAVEVGYRHPIELSSCLSLFETGKLYLFSGQRDAVDVVSGPVELVDAAHLTQVGLRAEAMVERPGQAIAPQKVDIPLKLAPSMQPPGRVVGTLIDGKDAMRLKQLVYLLPPSMLRGHRVVVTERGILIVAGQNVDLVPLGTLLAELAPGLLLPLGMDLVPRVAPDVLAGALGHGPGRLTVFPHEGGPFHVAESALSPLERRTLAALNAPSVAAADLSLDTPAGEPRVVNDAVGAFALWGFPTPSKALVPKE